jgi:imidazolonepropionase-like amidohydrolase/Tol biopolymer transport system component
MGIWMLFGWIVWAGEPVPSAEDTEEESCWDVSASPGPSETVKIDTHQGTWMSVDVSPDGRLIVFDLLGDLYTLPMEGGEATALTSGMAWDMQPTFSPQGDRVAFTSDRGGGDNLWTLPLDGGEPVQITDESFRLLNGPAWSPDGAYIVGRKHFTSGRSLGAGEMWLYPAEGGGPGLPLTSRPNDQQDVNEPTFSPDGAHLYYSQDVSPGPSFQYNKNPHSGIYAIQRLDLESGDVVRVTQATGGAARPTPSPDGERLAFVRRVREQTTLWVRDLDSGAERPLWDGLDRDMQEAWAIHGIYPRMAWTPDGESLVLWAQGGLHRVHLDGTIEPILFHVQDTREIRTAQRVPIEVAPDTFDVKMLRSVTVSPDGKRVVFQALGVLWVKELPDGQVRRLTRQTDHVEDRPTFTPDGRTVIYATWDDQAYGTLRAVSARGGRGRTLTDRPGHYRESTVSPDGRTLVFRRSRGGWLRSALWSEEPGLYVMGAGGGEATRLLDHGRSPHFGPDGDRVFFLSGEGESTALKSIGLTDRTVRTHATTEMGIDLRVSPDGRWLGLQEHYNAYVMPFPATGRSLTVSPDMTALKIRKVSEDAGNGIHFSADGTRAYSSLGPSLLSFDLTRPMDEDEPVIPEVIPLTLTRTTHHAKGTAALVGATLITMDGDTILEAGTVVWTDDRIVAIGPRDEVAVPEGAYVIDGTGLFALPGFIDVHAHGSMATDGLIPEQNWNQLSNLSFGVTTIHDPSNDTGSVFAASELQKAGRLLAPRIFSTGTILYGAKGPGYTAKVDSLEDALSHLTRMKEVGAFSVKSYNQPRRDQRQQVMEASRQLDMMVVPEGGSTFMHNLTMIVDGHTGIEHAIPVRDAYDDVRQLWGATSVGYTPTLGVAYGGLSGEEYWYGHTDVWANERLLSFVPRTLIDGRARWVQRIPDGEYNHDDAARFAKTLIDEGVTVQLGAHGQREGLAAHWEMWMFEQGGFTPHEALRSGTLHGAKYLGLDGDLGSLAVGKLADLVILDADPIADLKNSERVRYTILGGQIHEASTMDRLWPNPAPRGPLSWEIDGGQTDEDRAEATGCGCARH